LETDIQGFDLCVMCNSQLAFEEYADSGDDCHVQDAKHELSQDVTNKLKSPHSENFDADKNCWAAAAQYVAHGILESEEQIDTSSNAMPECVGYAGTYEVSEEEQVILAPESSEGSAVMYSTTTVSGSYLDVKMQFPKLSPGETSMKKSIIRKGIEKLPTAYLPQRNTLSGQKLGPYKEPKEEGTES
jgi:protein LTV1